MDESVMYHEGNRRLQDQFDSRRISDRLEEKLMRKEFSADDKQFIESATVVWAGGFRANPLTAQIPAERDRSGRLIVDRNLRMAAVPTVFATTNGLRAGNT